MMKSIFYMVASLIVCGCVPINQNNHITKKYTNEMVVKSTKNPEEIIKFYKEKLKNKENKTVRLKLVKEYLIIHDFESAEFYVLPLLKENPNAEVLFCSGKAEFGLQRLNKAKKNLVQALKLAPNDGRVLNLLGVIAGDEHDFEQARARFTEARHCLYDDMTIKNNLAMLDIIEGNYRTAVVRLSPLLSNMTVSEKVKSNLAFAYAKLGWYDSFFKLLKDEKKTDSDIHNMYYQLQSVVPNRLTLSGSEKSR